MPAHAERQRRVRNALTSVGSGSFEPATFSRHARHGARLSVSRRLEANAAHFGARSWRAAGNLVEQGVPSPVRLVCFDLGRVLVSIADSWTEACRRADVPKPLALDDPAIVAHLHEVLLELEVGRIDFDTNARTVAEHTGLDLATVRRVSASSLIGPYPGAASLLADVAQTGIPRACLSNTNAFHWELMLDPQGVYRELFDGLTHRFASHLIGAMKPEPATYQHVEDETGVPPQAIAFFDDLEVNVAAARARGWRAYRVAPADPIPEMRRALVEEGVLSQ